MMYDPTLQPSHELVSQWVNEIENCLSGQKSLGQMVTARDRIDTRSDDSIIASLGFPTPVKSERNVWAFWQTGVQTMPPWCQRNVIGWVRLLGPDWTVRVLDMVDGSANNVTKFAKPEHLPDALKSKTMSGQFSLTQTSDIVRLPCLYEHGGVYMDVGILLFMHLDDLCWRQLEDKSTTEEVAMVSVDPSLASGITGSFFIAARRRNGFIHRWMQVFNEVWKDRTNCQGVHDHPLFRHLISKGNVVQKLNATSPLELDYFGHLLAMERVQQLEDPYDGFSGPGFCKNRLLLLEYQECASAALLTGDDGLKQFQLLSTKLQQQEAAQTGDYGEAESFATFLFSQTAMMKLYHWTHKDQPTLANLWDKFPDADCTPGTFAWLLRIASAYFKQSRKIQPVAFPRDSGNTLVAGLLEVPDDEEEEEEEEEEDWN